AEINGDSLTKDRSLDAVLKTAVKDGYIEINVVLFIPLFPLILCCLVAFPILFPCAIFMIITGLILQSKRKRFFKTIEDSVFLDKPAN
ncbi:MAG: hypothetical protein IIT53_10065, partial [Fibrobacter sp.]|nr:hypothetical protein [Fibrobacter sp.]